MICWMQQPNNPFGIQGFRPNPNNPKNQEVYRQNNFGSIPNLPVKPIPQYPNYQNQRIQRIQRIQPAQLSKPTQNPNQLILQNSPKPKKSPLKNIILSSLVVSFLFFVGGLTYYFYEKRGAFGVKVKALNSVERDFSGFEKKPAEVSVLDFESITFAAQSQSGKFGQTSNRPAVDPSLYKSFTGERFKNFYEQTILTYQNIDSSKPATKPSIRQNSQADQKIQALAEARGYKLRPNAIESKLQFVDGQQLQQEALQSWLLLKSAAASDGIQLELVSGYRSVADQKKIFNDGLGPSVTDEQIINGLADSQIDEVLKTSSIPGYSRHHTGFTLDFGCGNKNLTIFAQTPCYEWLSRFNYLNAKRFGFIPSYPQGAGNQGPDPEAWEYVWVGERNLRS